jgi:NAD(P)-dependent dehydrogenase (short-subunit alcohol dehydrogenase family)
MASTSTIASADLTGDKLAASALFNVNNIVAVVTGGGTGITLRIIQRTHALAKSQGIGWMIAKALTVNGAHRVYIVGRRAEVLQDAAQSIDQGQNVVVPLPGDVTDRSSLLAMAGRVEAEVGYVNLVVANAGIMGPRPLQTAPGEMPPSLAEYRAHALETPMEDFTKTYAVNASAVHYTALAFLSLLDAGNSKGNMGPDWRSQIIATSSIGGFSRLKNASFAYNSSKAAATHMMKMMATAYVPYKIRCNVLAPGIFPSELAGGTIANLGPGHRGVFEPSFVPAERPGNEEDIAGAILYLASRAGAYLNGSVVVVDGGRLSTLVSTY